MCKMPQQHPMITIFNMANFLLNSKYSQKLLNSTLESGQWKHDLASFWAKFKAVDPGHVVFREHCNNLEHCIPCLFHGDEGVGHRRKPVLQLSWGPLLRTGLGSLQRLFLITSCPHVYYSQFNEGASAGNPVVDNLLKECSISARKAYLEGISTEHGCFFLVFLGLAGDHPWQTKAYQCERGHLRNSLCPCLANTSDRIPFEDVSKKAVWRHTLFQSVPWDRRFSPPLALIPGADHPGFIKWDLFHMLPHGCVRNFVASCICMLAGPLGHFMPTEDGMSKKKEMRLKVAYSYFADWCFFDRKPPKGHEGFYARKFAMDSKQGLPGHDLQGVRHQHSRQMVVGLFDIWPLELGWAPVAGHQRPRRVWPICKAVLHRRSFVLVQLQATKRVESNQWFLAVLYWAGKVVASTAVVLLFVHTEAALLVPLVSWFGNFCDD